MDAQQEQLKGDQKQDMHGGRHGVWLHQSRPLLGVSTLPGACLRVAHGQF